MYMHDAHNVVVHRDTKHVFDKTIQNYVDAMTLRRTKNLAVSKTQTIAKRPEITEDLEKRS